VDEGSIVERGKHEELIKNGGKYAGFVRIRKEAENWQIN
jgi:ATP-binding cassette subfamily B protein